MKLVLTRGIPASGKSSWARHWVQEDENRVRVNRDDIRRMLFVVPTYSWTQEEQVSRIEKKIVEGALANDNDVIIDAMNLRSKYVREWLKIAQKFKAEVELVDFPISLEEAIERDSKREGVEHIGETFIRETYQKFTKKDGSLVAPPKLKVEEEVLFTRYGGTPGKPKAIIFDIDGTLAKNLSGRGWYDYDRVHEDSPNHSVVAALRAAYDHGYEIIYCSGRSDDCRDITEKWLADNVGIDGPLFMRKYGDYRKDSIVKQELFDNHIRDHYDVVCTYDDRDQVVRMWRELGIPCFQVDFGDF